MIHVFSFGKNSKINNNSIRKRQFHLFSMPQRAPKEMHHHIHYSPPSTMAPRAILEKAILIFTVLALISSDKVHAVDCSSLILNMADCLSFVTSGSTVEKPEGTCCSGLKTVVRSGPQCLCEAFKNSASLGVTLDLSKAASLPSVCKVNAPPSARCGREFPFFLYI